ncbi:MAG: restriction endonuclease subunit R [Hormoscilla sp. GM102CHS1]|nr:restriction endonuclease subunit R [Hormoscilla sp. GM102CHS1]
MTTIQASKVTLAYLREKFNLQRTADEHFFTEWLTDLPELSDGEKQALDQVKSNYIYLAELRPMMEDIVKMVVVSRLLELAGFFQPPFEIDGEPSIEIFVEDSDDVIKGNIDVLVLHKQLWVIVIESKRNALSLEAGKPQILAEMLDNPHPEKPSFGLITNGTNFSFLKLTKQSGTKYAVSNNFSLTNRGNDLYSVLRILKRLGQLALQ